MLDCNIGWCLLVIINDNRNKKSIAIMITIMIIIVINNIRIVKVCKCPYMQNGNGYPKDHE
jgi:hypothetical protein